MFRKSPIGYSWLSQMDHSAVTKMFDSSEG